MAFSKKILTFKALDIFRSHYLISQMTNIPAAVVEIHHQVPMETNLSLGCSVVAGTASRLISWIGWFEGSSSALPNFPGSPTVPNASTQPSFPRSSWKQRNPLTSRANHMEAHTRREDSVAENRSGYWIILELSLRESPEWLPWARRDTEHP